MSLLEDIRFSNSMNNLQELLNGYFVDLERAIDRYIFRIANDSVGNYGDTEQQIEVQNRQKQMLENIDYIVDGRFVEELKDPKLQFRGSSNQRIIDVKKSLEQNDIVIWDGLNKNIG